MPTREHILCSLNLQGQIKVKISRIVKSTLRYIVWAIILFIFLFPMFWIIASSIKMTVEQTVSPPVWFPFNPTLDHYKKLFSMEEGIRGLINSTIVTASTAILVMILALPTAYAISRFRVGGSPLLISIMIIRLLPPISYCIPFYILARKYGFYDTRTGLVLVYTFFTLPIIIWLMLGFFDEVPKELEEAAMIDGCSRLQALLRIILPLVRPGLAATAVFCALTAWNEFLLPLVLTGFNARTLPVLVQTFVTQRATLWGLMSATGTILVLPMIVFGFAVGKHLVRGLVKGAVKG